MVIQDAFDADGKGTVIIGIPEIAESRIVKGSVIFLRCPAQDDSSIEVLDRELMRNCWSPDKPRALALLISRKRLAASIPRNSEVWVEP